MGDPISTLKPSSETLSLTTLFSLKLQQHNERENFILSFHLVTDRY